jgi:long-chain acyl-CoA synthetase
MIGMTPNEWSGVPADVAAERASIEAEIAGSTLLIEYARTVSQAPDTVAHQWLDDGEWRTLTYRQVYDQVRDAALGLAGLGLAPAEFVVIWSRNRSEATIADYAVLHARGVPVFIYNTVSAEQAQFIAGHCGAAVAIVEPEFLPRLRTVLDQLPKLRHVIVLSPPPTSPPATGPAAVASPADPDAAAGDDRSRSWDGVLAAGHAAGARAPELFERTWRQVKPDDLVTLIYTSGTTGQPKAVMLTQHSTRFYQTASYRVVPAEDHSDDDGNSRMVSYLPMAHVTGRALDHWAPMLHPVTIAYCPDQLRLFEIVPQVHPTVFMGIPRVWEKLHAALLAALPDVATPEAAAALPDAIKQAVLVRIGLDQCRLAVSGSAPIDSQIMHYFKALGLPLSEGWGMTELNNAATLVPPQRARVGAVGRAYPGVEIRLSDDSEILVRGPLLMRGYYRDPERTAEAIDADGWMHTGDIGELDPDGYLKIVDRKKELIITSGGKNISPALIEYELQRHPLIGQACAIGDRRNYVTALLVLDPDSAPAWARERALEFESTADLAVHPVVLAEVERAVAAANQHLARVEHVRRWALLPDEWTAQTGELTPSLKRRRRAIVDKYAKEIEALYG